MKTRILPLILFVASLVGCASSPSHLGEHWGSRGAIGVGKVSKEDGLRSEAFIENFRTLIWAQKYREAYRLLSKDISSKVSQADFANAIQEIEKSYGIERSWSLSRLEDAEVLAKVAMFDEALRADAFKYYQAVGAQYRSIRKKSLLYTFLLHKPKDSEEIKLLSLGVFEEASREPIFVLHPLRNTVR
jgi:hypothetical protein